jgi:hypothetical protein
VAGEGDHVVAVVERQLGEESAGEAIGPEHCKLHRFVPFDVRRALVRGGYINKDAGMTRSVTSAAVRAVAEFPRSLARIAQLC